MIGNLKKYIDKASFMEHIDAKLRQNEGVSKCAPSFFMHKAPTFTSRGFVIT